MPHDLAQRRPQADDETTARTTRAVRYVLASPGRPLDSETRSYFESRMGGRAARNASTSADLQLGDADATSERAADRLAHHVTASAPAARPAVDFSGIRVHTGAAAESSARELGALAWSVGPHLAFGPGRYQPGTPSGRRLLAHELAHSLQPGAERIVRRQTDPHTQPPGGHAAGPAAPPRPDFVFIMGTDPPRSTNRFYELAARYYQVRVPRATIVRDVNNLDDLIQRLNATVHVPIGDLYIVAHGNENGTLGFGLNAADLPGPGERHASMTVPELNAALNPTTGGRTLTRLNAGQIDRGTRILIKGCNVGRTQAVVELISQAFGGLGSVTAPTHEQDYETDPTLESAARRSFRDSVAAAHPAPAAVDPHLRGRDRLAAQRQHAVEVRQRTASINAELTARRGEEDALAATAGIQESLSGPMFQRPGTTLFTAGELGPQVDQAYGHLTPTQRITLTRDLVAPDRRPPAVAAAQGTFNQSGQRLDRKRLNAQRDLDPQDVAEAVRVNPNLRQGGFRPAGLHVAGTFPAARTFTVDGTEPVTGGPRATTTREFTVPATPATDATLLTTSRALLGNPERYAWRIDSAHARTGVTTRTAIAERVVAYLHHRSLDRSAHQHFTAALTNPGFYATSTPPPAPPRPRTP